MSKNVNTFVMIIGLIILFITSILSIIGTNYIVYYGIIPALFGVALFISGYIGININNKQS